jgi:sterol desaturase/sphingolipid hydroxylase (fatty acid hydroxylase superfamily)
LPLLGVPPWMIFTAFSINLIFQFFVHTERIGTLPAPVEFVFNTPSHHRVHHASDKDYLDKNFGGILIIWDRLFGTYVQETHRPTYGLTKNIDSYNQFTVQYQEYGAIVRDVRQAHGWRERLGYVFAPPGWSPDQKKARLSRVHQSSTVGQLP